MNDTPSTNLTEDFCDVPGNKFDFDSVLGLRIFAMSLLITGITLIPAFYVYFLKNRKSYQRLEHRNTFLLSCYTLGSILLVINYSLRAFIGNKNYSCRSFVIVANFQSILIVESSIVRLFSLLWRVQYNYKLIEETHNALVTGNLDLATGSVRFVRNSKRTRKSKRNKQSSYYEDVFNEEKPMKLPTQSPWFTKILFTLFNWHPPAELPSNLHYANFLASKYFVSALFVVLGLLSGAVAVLVAFLDFPIGQDCTGCGIDDGESDDYVSLVTIFTLGFFFGCALVALYGVCRLRKIPDSLGIRKELIILAVTFLVINNGIVVPLKIGFREIEENGSFEFSLIAVIEIVILSFYVLTYQVYVAKKGINDKVNVDMALKQVLESNEGSQAFALYLASCLSLETLYFYKIANEWKDKYNEYSEEERDRVMKDIYAKYIDPEAFMLINISSSCRRQLENDIRENNVTENLFDMAINEMYGLMATDLFGRFMKTSYYKAFINEL